jgi:hypothetical protein
MRRDQLGDVAAIDAAREQRPGRFSSFSASHRQKCKGSSAKALILVARTFNKGPGCAVE